MITKVRPQGGLSVRYIWLHMATCIMGLKADDGILRGADDADFQQRDDSGWKRWSHVHPMKGVSWALTAVENFKGFVDSRRIAATFNDLRKWQVSRLSHKPSQPTVALPHRMIVTSDYLVLLSQWQQVWKAGPLPSEHVKDRLKLCFRGLVFAMW